jgi:hypothetical protein
MAAADSYFEVLATANLHYFVVLSSREVVVIGFIGKVAQSAVVMTASWAMAVDDKMAEAVMVGQIAFGSDIVVLDRNPVDRTTIDFVADYDATAA